MVVTNLGLEGYRWCNIKQHLLTKTSHLISKTWERKIALSGKTKFQILETNLILEWSQWCRKQSLLNKPHQLIWTVKRTMPSIEKDLQPLGTINYKTLMIVLSLDGSLWCSNCLTLSIPHLRIKTCNHLMRTFSKERKLIWTLKFKVAEIVILQARNLCCNNWPTLNKKRRRKTNASQTETMLHHKYWMQFWVLRLPSMQITTQVDFLSVIKHPHLNRLPQNTNCFSQSSITFALRITLSLQWLRRLFKEI